MKGEQAEQRVYFDGAKIPVTPEKKVLDALNLNTCCRTHFLTQVDLMDKI
jgi:DNA-directed RNA polymerase subunit N (RpoN/RPB10)